MQENFTAASFWACGSSTDHFYLKWLFGASLPGGQREGRFLGAKGPLYSHELGAPVLGWKGKEAEPMILQKQ